MSYPDQENKYIRKIICLVLLFVVLIKYFFLHLRKNSHVAEQNFKNYFDCVTIEIPKYTTAVTFFNNSNMIFKINKLFK